MFMRFRKAGHRTTAGRKQQANIWRESPKILIASLLSRSIAKPKGRRLFCLTVAQCLACRVMHDGYGTENSAARLVCVGSQAPRIFLLTAKGILGIRWSRGSVGADMPPALYG